MYDLAMPTHVRNAIKIYVPHKLYRSVHLTLRKFRGLFECLYNLI